MKLEGLTKSELAELAQLAQAESAKRKARADLTAWCRLAGYIPASHQALLVRALERIGLPAVPGTADPPPGRGRISDQPSLIPGGPPTSAPISPAVKLGEVGSITSLPKFLPARPKVEHVRASQVNGGPLVRAGGRLMVFMPPGSAKSTYCSVLFPAWFMGQDWGGNVLAASHSTELAERFGRKVRNLMQERGDALETSISGDSGAAGRWETTSGREYYAAGAGVGIAGFRAKLGIIDDPFRGRADAESKTIRDRIWEWYNDDFDTRCVPGAHQILIMTRYHEDDLAGRLLTRGGPVGRGGWEVLSLPAIAGLGDALGRAPGEWLWEGEYGYADQLRAKFATSDARSWASLYQQNPVPDEGAFFDASWLRPVRFLPEKSRLRYYGASDYAVTQNGGDYTVHLVVGIDAKGRLYLVDLWRGQTGSAEWVKAWCDLVKKWKPFEWAEERGQILSSIGPFLEQEAAKQRAFTFRRQFPSKHDKAVRAQSIRARMSMGGLYVPEGISWLSEFTHELLRFPSAVHDDQVDALGLIGQLLDHIQAPVAEEDNVITLKSDDYEFASYDDADDDDEMELNWKVL